MNFIADEKNQHLWMYYHVGSFDKKPGFISVVIPFAGKLEPEEGWQSKSFDSGSTVLFKNFTCVEEGCSKSSGYVTFNFTEPITSFRSPNLYLQIPFSPNPNDNDIDSFIRELKPENSNVVFGWSDIDTEVTAIFDNEFDDWSTQPISNLQSYIRQSNSTNIILSWEVEDSNSLFIAKYSREIDRSFYDYRLLWVGAGFSGGITLLVAGVAITRSDEGLNRLKRFVKVQRHIQDANTAYTNKNFESAKNHFDLAIKDDKNNLDSLLMAGNSFYERKRYDDALPYFEKVLKIDEKYLGAINNIGVCHARLGDDEKALGYYEKVLEINKNHINALINMGASVIDLGLPEFALPYFDEALKIDKKDVLALTNKAKVFAFTDDFKAIDFCNQSLKIDPKNILALEIKSLSLIKLNKNLETIACLDLILKIEPNNKLALQNKGVALMNLDEFDKALPLIEEFLVTEFDNDVAWYNKGLIYGEKKDYDNATLFFNNALEFGLSDPVYLNNVGRYMVEHADPNIAMQKCFLKVLKEDKNNLEAINGMSYAFKQLKNIPESDAWYQKYLDAKKVNPP